MRALVLLVLLCAAVDSSPDTGVDGASDFAVAAYLPEWRYEGANWDTIAEHVTHLILFSLEIAPDGSLSALDRIPRPELLKQARSAATRHGTQLMICFGGNGRSAGFSPMVRDAHARARFISELVKLCDKHDFDGVDYNWEYPGYDFGRGYLPDSELRADYDGLGKLLRETRAAFSEGSARARSITMAYYPDGRQEQLLFEHDAHRYVNLLHMMSYDQGGEQHSSYAFGKLAVKRGLAHLPAASLTLGLPFYGRHSKTGDWVTYEDIVQGKQHGTALVGKGARKLDSVFVAGGSLGFNGPHTIGRKTKFAVKKRLGGVMIWEVGQDCRIHEVKHGAQTHVANCPEGPRSSLLVAITRAMTKAGVQRARAPGWSGGVDMDKDEL